METKSHSSIVRTDPPQCYNLAEKHLYTSGDLLPMLDDLADLHDLSTHDDTTTPDTHDAPPVHARFTEAREWISPGVSLRKRWLTGIGVALAALIFLGVSLYEGSTALVSTLIGIVFIAGFIGYLRVVAPRPFTLRLDAQGITRTERNGEPVSVGWGQIARVKEEVFKNGTSVSLSVYKRVGARGVHRAFIVYRDDIPHFDDFSATFAAALPAETPWQRETVHE